MTTVEKSGERIDRGPYIPDIDFSAFGMRPSTARYTSREFHERERERLWMRVWQVVCRADDLPDAGDWLVHQLFDQSYIIVRDRDGTLRGFVNACRHRGNAFCEGKGHSARFICPYHNWSYGLDGQCLAVAKPDFDGTVEDFVGCGKDELSLIAVAVDCFGGYVFMNPDRDAEPLLDYLGEAAMYLSAYRLDEMVPVDLHRRETLECNWKVVIDAFQEGYHIQGIHPELIGAMDESKERYTFFGDHHVATAPFGAAEASRTTPEDDVEGVRFLPINFPGLADVIPCFERMVDACRDGDGAIAFPEGVNARVLLQRATREVFGAKGLDVSGLTDNQLSDNQFWIVFPNLFMTIRPEGYTAITAEPHPDGDPNRCIWQVSQFQWLPPEERAAKRTPLTVTPEGKHEPYYLTLEQDYEQMQRQQKGLRNSALGFMALTKQDIRVAHFQASIDAWVSGDSNA